MSASRLLLGASLVLLVSAPCVAQPAAAPPTLTRAQRAALQALVRAVDAAAPSVAIADADWPLHVLRVSDGSHYVAFSIYGGALIPAKPPVALYVRLSTRRAPTTTAAPERSAIAEWLAGTSPVPVLPRRGIAIGEMPTYGAAGIASRGPGPSQNLRLLELERERAREKREAQERTRKAALEGTDTTRIARPLLPFEDFDVQASVAVDGSGTPVLRRSLTAGPGDYELSVAWVDPNAADPASAVRVARRALSLPAASATAFALSSVILADSVSIRETPVPAIEQTAHPYSIGPTEIEPARDHTLTTDERLALVVQVINARGSAAGKPDVVVGFRVLRRSGASEDLVGTLVPQVYDDTTLPADFDIAKGHPIFAAVAVPPRSFKRGEYRLEVSANDRVAGTGTLTNTLFTVVATPAALLREAPALAAPFVREDILHPRVLDEITARLRPQAPSAAMLDALATARDRRFVELVRDDEIAPEEAGPRGALRALALYALGDTPASLAAPLRLAEQHLASPAAVQIIAGGLRALGGNDREALAAWDAALAAGAEAAALGPLMTDAWLRLGDANQAVAIARRALAAGPGDAPVTRSVAAALLAANQRAEALAALDTLLAQDPGDVDAQWLALHTLFSGFVTGVAPGSDAAARSRLVALAERYTAANGRHAALARDWAAAVEGVAPLPPRPER
jgi:tetratricopeptide (TPR) repeat protein